MKKSAYAVIASMALLVWACGGRTSGGNGDSGAAGDDRGDDGGNGDGGACEPLPGCSSTTSCRSTDGCNECSCVNGAWACGDLACVDASTTCPTTGPAIGSFCADNGLVCTFGTQCGPEYVCRNNTWNMVIRTCPPPPTCPRSPPSGSCNGEVGLTCSWGSGCNQEMCQCVSMGNQAAWECSGSACVDAGHSGD